MSLTITIRSITMTFDELMSNSNPFDRSSVRVSIGGLNYFYPMPAPILDDAVPLCSEQLVNIANKTWGNAYQIFDALKSYTPVNNLPVCNGNATIAWMGKCWLLNTRDMEQYLFEFSGFLKCIEAMYSVERSKIIEATLSIIPVTPPEITDMSKYRKDGKMDDIPMGAKVYNDVLRRFSARDTPPTNYKDGIHPIRVEKVECFHTLVGNITHEDPLGVEVREYLAEALGITLAQDELGEEADNAVYPRYMELVKDKEKECDDFVFFKLTYNGHTFAIHYKDGEYVTESTLHHDGEVIQIPNETFGYSLHGIVYRHLMLGYDN